MKKVNLLSKAEMKKVMGGNVPIPCSVMTACAFRGPGNQMLSGSCGETINGRECRCIVLDPITGDPYQSLEMSGCYPD